MKTKILRLGKLVLALLCIPLLAMQLTNQVNWRLSDFVCAGILLFGAGLCAIGIQQLARKRWIKIVLFFILLAILLLIWAELAVGILDSSFAGS
ncbi:MAG: hypothetical protein RL699_1163 [Bacteroidota bacterium]|jgi:hypothetical protein